MTPNNPSKPEEGKPTFEYECAFCGGEGNADERCSGMMTEPDHPPSVEMIPKGTRDA